jgi:hypothetical protein
MAVPQSAADHGERVATRAVRRAFWAALAILFGATLALLALASLWHPPSPSDPPDHAAAPTMPRPQDGVEEHVLAAARAAAREAQAALERKIGEAFGRAEAAVGPYAAAHFSDWMPNRQSGGWSFAGSNSISPPRWPKRTQP